MTVLKRLMHGYLVGVANIIPGVSGGTLALILGIYPRLLNALGNFDLAAARSLARALGMRPGAWPELRLTIRRLDIGFLALLGAGALAAVFSLSRLIEFLLRNRLTETYAFFFGLILASVYFPYRLLLRRGWIEGMAVCAAAAATLALTINVDESGLLERAERKSAARIEADAASGAAPAADAVSRVLVRRPASREALRFFSGAALAVAAMILPGVSGSFVLLMLGIYFDVLGAVNARDIVLLGVFMAGGVFGLLALSRLVSACLRRAFSVTMAAMIGLMLGSLWGLWPFKRAALVGTEMVVLGNRLPERPREAVAAALICALAAALAAAFALLDRYAGRSPADA